MDSLCPPTYRADCADLVICRCLKVKAPELVEAITSLELRTLKDVRCRTGAGDGCTACHQEIQEYLERHGRSALPAWECPAA